MAKLEMTIMVTTIEDGTFTLSELADEIAKILYQKSREGTFKIHERAVISDMFGIKADG